MRDGPFAIRGVTSDDRSNVSELLASDSKAANLSSVSTTSEKVGEHISRMRTNWIGPINNRPYRLTNTSARSKKSASTMERQHLDLQKRGERHSSFLFFFYFPLCCEEEARAAKKVFLLYSLSSFPKRELSGPRDYLKDNKKPQLFNGIYTCSHRVLKIIDFFTNT